MTYLGKTTLTKIAIEFCKVIEKSGYTAGVYANANWFKNYLNYNEIKKSYSIWLAQYGDKKDFSCDIWQYTSQGKIRKNAGNFDMNYIYKNPVIYVTVKKKTGLYKYGYRDYITGTSKEEKTTSVISKHPTIFFIFTSILLIHHTPIISYYNKLL